MSVAFQYLNPNETDDDLIAKLETYSHSDFWYHWGYYNAGEILFENWHEKYKVRGDHISIDSIVFPIYYCYRHSVEVCMKKLLRTMTGEHSKPNHHIKKLLLDISKAGIEIPDYVEKFIDELDSIDPSFTRFRYDTQKNGKKNDMLKVNLIGMVKGFRLVYKFFYKTWNEKYKKDRTFIDNHHNRFAT